MDHALFLRCGNSQIFPQASTRSKIIKSRKFSNDLIFLRLKNTIPLISSLSNCGSTTLTVGQPQGISTARRLISTTTLAHHGRFSSTPSPSSSDHDPHQDDYEGDNDKIARTSSFRAGAGASLALSCVLGILCCGSMILFMNPSKAIAGFYQNLRSYGRKTDIDHTDLDSMISPLSGTDTMRAFLNGILYLTSPKGTTMSEVPSFYRDDIADLKKRTLELIKVGKSDEALQQLIKKRNALKATDPEGKYYVEMVLVEILISQGKYQEASNMSCLEDADSSIPTDIRRDLYKAIIYTMLGKTDIANAYWVEFLGKGFKGGPSFSRS